MFALEAWAPALDLHLHGVDTIVGGYQIGSCVLRYDFGGYTGSVEPGEVAFPEDYQYRGHPVDGRPARWVTYTAANLEEDMPGPYLITVYVPGFKLEVACPTIKERQQALTALEGLRFRRAPRGDLANVGSMGPATFSPAPDLCARTAAPAAGGTGVGTIEIVVGIEATMGRFALLPSPPMFWDLRQGPAILTTASGTYTLEAAADDTPTVRCRDVVVKPGQVTTVRIDRFEL